MAAIVTTLRFGCDGAEPIFSFIAYHLSIGFEHVYCFLDHPTNNYISELVYNKFGVAFVTVFLRSDDLLLKQKDICSKYVELEKYILSEVPARQTINAEYAYHLASDAGYRWLLHIDIDELFYIDGNSSVLTTESNIKTFNVNSHFDHLDSIGAQSMTYMNHEGVPECFDSLDPFASTTLFRRHHFGLPVNQVTSRDITFWKNRTTYQQYFLVYDNGKSAVRLGLTGARPKDVHRWLLPDLADQSLCAESDIGNDIRYRTALMDPRTLQVKRLLRVEQPCILHFVTCGFRWLLDKYTVLGRFPSFWFGDRLPIAPSFHLNARDVVLGVTDQGESTQQSEKERHDTDIRNTAKFFVQQILLNCQSAEKAAVDITLTLSSHLTEPHEGGVLDFSAIDLSDHSEERDRQLRSGVLMRLDRVQKILCVIRQFNQSQQESVDGDQYVRHIRTLVDEVPPEDMNRLKQEDLQRSVGGKNTMGSHSDAVSELDKLRIISQVAYNFL